MQLKTLDVCVSVESVEITEISGKMRLRIGGKTFEREFKRKVNIVIS